MANIGALTDDFTTADSVKWSGYGASITVSAGALNIACTSGYLALTTAASYTLVGSAALVQAVKMPNYGNGSTSAYMLISQSSGNELTFMQDSTTLTFRETVASVDSDTSVTYSSTAHAWWRIRESAGLIYWETSADGLAWTTRRSKTTPLTVTSVSLVLGSGFYGTEPTPGSAVFDNLNLPPVPVVEAEGAKNSSAMAQMIGGVSDA